MSQRKAGIVFFKVDGIQYQAKGNFSYSYGKPVREAIIGADGVHGYKETPVAPFIEGEITDSMDLSVDSIANWDGVTATLELNNGKVFVLRNAWSVNSDGFTGNTEEGNLPIRLEGLSAEEVR